MLLGALLSMGPPAAGGVSLEGGGSAGVRNTAAPGALAGREVRASCWQDGVKVVELPSFAAADLGGARDAAVLLRGRAGGGGTVALVPLGQALCAVEVGND